MYEAACDWRVCAVGERLKIWYDDRKFDALGPAITEVDPRLDKFGADFAAHICRREWAAAAVLHKAIRHRLTPARIARIKKAWRQNMREMSAVWGGSA